MLGAHLKTYYISKSKSCVDVLIVFQLVNTICLLVVILLIVVHEERAFLWWSVAIFDYAGYGVRKMARVVADAYVVFRAVAV